MTALALLTGGAAFAAIPMASRGLAQHRLAALCARSRSLVLTYDDGPCDHATPEILDTLLVRGARATFFALGRQADQHPAILDRALDEGHEVGSHSWGHLHAWKSSPWAAARDVSRGLGAVSRWVPPDGLFRPAYGKVTALTWAVAKARGARMAWWTRDSGDSWATPPSAESVVASVRRARGGVVLMHDGRRDPARRAFVLDLTVRLLGAARDDGLRVRTLGDLLREGRNS